MQYEIAKQAGVLGWCAFSLDGLWDCDYPPTHTYEAMQIQLEADGHEVINDD